MSTKAFKNYIAAFFLASAFFVGPPSYAQDSAPEYEQDTLTGDWAGLRTDLHNNGYDFELSYTADFWRFAARQPC